MIASVQLVSGGVAGAGFEVGFAERAVPSPSPSPFGRGDALALGGGAFFPRDFAGAAAFVFLAADFAAGAAFLVAFVLLLAFFFDVALAIVPSRSARL